MGFLEDLSPIPPGSEAFHVVPVSSPDLLLYDSVCQFLLKAVSLPHSQNICPSEHAHF